MDRIHVDIEKPWLTVADICEYMDVSTFVVTSVLRSGELPAVKFGREWRISRNDFENWINQQRTDSYQPSADASPQFTALAPQTNTADVESQYDLPPGD